MNRTFLIVDANALVHRFFHAMPPFTDPQGNPSGALYGLSSVLLKIFKEWKPTYIAAAFDTPEKTFREETYEAYKSNRPAAADDLVFQIIEAQRVFEVFDVPLFAVPGFEADDLIGTLAETFKSLPDLHIEILSGDHDVLQLVENGKISALILKNGISNTVRYDEASVTEKYGVPPRTLPDYKGLVGDPSDHIPGIRGIGPKTAALLLQKFGNIETLFSRLEEVGMSVRKKLEGKREEALFSKSLSTIKRDVPLDLKTLEVLRAKTPDKKILETYFKAHGFQSLIERMNTL